MNVIVIVDWATRTGYVGRDGQAVTYPDVDAARAALARLTATADVGSLGVASVPADRLGDVGGWMAEWLADAPARYAQRVAVLAAERAGESDADGEPVERTVAA